VDRRQVIGVGRVVCTTAELTRAELHAFLFLVGLDDQLRLVTHDVRLHVCRREAHALFCQAVVILVEVEERKPKLAQRNGVRGVVGEEGELELDRVVGVAGFCRRVEVDGTKATGHPVVNGVFGHVLSEVFDLEVNELVVERAHGRHQN